MEHLRRGDSLRFLSSGLRIDVLHPGPAEPTRLANSRNDASLALRLTYRRDQILFLGDLEEVGVARLLGTTEDLHAQGLIYPHHGRHHGLGGELIERVQPEWVIITGNGNGGARETAAALRSIRIPVHCTWESGALRTRWTSDEGWVPRVAVR